MKKVLLFLAASAALNCCAQFKTTYNQNGDPLTEIIDEDGMKQGDWMFYDLKGNLYKKESYSDNNLVHKTHIINNIEVNSLNFKEEKLQIPSQNISDFNYVSGEYIIDSKNGLESLFFYKKDLAKNIDVNKVENLVKGIVSSTPNNGQIIYTF